MDKKNRWEKCKTCRFYDKEKSNENWIACNTEGGAIMPLEVMLSGTSKDCKKYEKS